MSTIDLDPATESERQARRHVVQAQARELAACNVWMTCACGQRFSFAVTGYRCRSCGIVFCPACALRHFDLVADGATVRRRTEESVLPGFACELTGAPA
jgi:hypothetical protein